MSTEENEAEDQSFSYQPVKKRKIGARAKIRAFLEANVGKIVTTQEISDVAGINDYQRRIRELRDEEGMPIKSHIDIASLKPGQYILESLDRVPSIERRISPQLRSEVLERDGFTCQQCGATAGDPDPYNPTRKVRLHVDHIRPISQGGLDEIDNLHTLCSTCNQGKRNIQAPTETALNILARIRGFLPIAPERYSWSFPRP